MDLKYFLCFFYLLLCSCSIQPSEGLKQWWNNWKEYGLTQMASESTANLLSEKDKANILVLFLDLEEANNCSQFKRLIEQNETLRTIEANNNFNEGSLFDAFKLNGLNYAQALLNGGTQRNSLAEFSFLIVGTWKTEFTMERINRVISDINYCYPYSSNSTST